MCHLGREKRSHVHQESWRSIAPSASCSLQQPTLTLQWLEPVFRAGTTCNQISSQKSKKPFFDAEEVVSIMEYPWGLVHKQGIRIAFLKEWVPSTRGLLGTPAPRSRFAPGLQRCVAKYKQITITSECWSKAGPPGGIKPLSHLVHPGKVQVLALKNSISLKAGHHRCGSQDTWMARCSLQESSLQESSVLQEQLEHTNHQGEINN